MLLPVVSGLNRLACFVAKRVNETSLILSAMAVDVDSMQHAVDFLLLAHGHSYEEFDGMCYRRIFWDRSLAGRVGFIRLGEEPHSNWAYDFLYCHNYFVHCAMFVILSAKGSERMIKTTLVVEIQKWGTVMANS